MSYRLQVLITKELDDRLRKAALRHRISKGEWVRRAIETALEQQTTVRRDYDPLATLESLQAPTADIRQLLTEIESRRS